MPETVGSDNYTRSISADDLSAMVGREIGVSDWFELDQARINTFADVTEDWFYIHTDPARAAAETPWGGTIAHGFLTLSLLSAMAYQAAPGIKGAERSVNYGFDRVRFVAPVPTGRRVRGRFSLSACDTSKPSEITVTYAVTVEIEDHPRPAVAADWICRHFTD